mgnify:CR=1 FL=1
MKVMKTCIIPKTYMKENLKINVVLSKMHKKFMVDIKFFYIYIFACEI